MNRILGIMIAMLMLLSSPAFAEPEIAGPSREGITTATITWDDATTSVALNIAPDTDTAVNVFRATTISLSCSTLTTDDIGGTSNLSTDVDVDILASADCSNYDTVTQPYVVDAIEALDDNQHTTVPIESGPRCMKLRADNNAGGTLDLTCRITATWE